MKTLKILPPEFYNNSKVNASEAVIKINSKKEADKFFKNKQHSRFEFIESRLDKKGNYILRYRENLNNDLDKPKTFTVRNAYINDDYDSINKIKTVKFFDKYTYRSLHL